MDSGDLKALAGKIEHSESGDFGDGSFFVRWRSLPFGPHQNTSEMQILEKCPDAHYHSECFDLKQRLREAGHELEVNLYLDGSVGVISKKTWHSEGGNSETKAIARLFNAVMPDVTRDTTYR